MKSPPRARSPTLLRILLYSGFGAKCGAPHFVQLLPNTLKGFGFSDFLDTELLPDRGVEHLYAGGLAHFGGGKVWWSFRNFSRISAVCG